jgi:hypothetical protein
MPRNGIITLSGSGSPPPPSRVHTRPSLSRRWTTCHFWSSSSITKGAAAVPPPPPPRGGSYHAGEMSWRVVPGRARWWWGGGERRRMLNPTSVGSLPDGYVRTNPLPQVPTKQSVPTSRICLPTYFGLPVVIPTLRRIVGPAIARARIPW